MQTNAGQPRQKPGSSLFLSQHHQQIQLPMLGPNLQVQQNKLQQGQQPGPQQQQGPQPSEIPLPPQSGQDFTLSSVLHFLQTEWRRYERDRNEWEIERAEMRVRTPPLVFMSRLTVPGHAAGSHRSARRRATLLRQCEARSHAAHQDARVCIACRAVRTLVRAWCST